MTVYIYTLTDPITNKIRYVGKTNDVSRRYRAHLNRARKHQSHKKNWINSLKKKGLKPIIDVIDEVSIDEWQFWETYWIAQCKAWGFSLVNHTYGGDGCTFANKTSFKKGNIPWNAGTALIKVCENCSKEFKPSYGSSQKTCSYKCASKNRTGHEDTQFKTGSIPWNKNNSGYKTSKRKPILQYSLEGEFIKEWECCKDAAEHFKCNIEGIRNACVGKAKTAQNFKWSYKEK